MFDDDFRDLERRLADSKPDLTALELDAAKVRIKKSVTTGMFARKKGTFMKSRVALVCVLALGVFMSGTGATLAVSGFANSGSAGSTQYPHHNQHHKHHGHHVVEAANTNGGKCGSGSGNSASSGSGNSGKCHETEAVDAAAVEQTAVTGSSSSLPFTGFAAIPVLIVGLGLLGAGVAMRVRRRDESA